MCLCVCVCILFYSSGFLAFIQAATPLLFYHSSGSWLIAFIAVATSNVFSWVATPSESLHSTSKAGQGKYHLAYGNTDSLKVQSHAELNFPRILKLLLLH